MGADILERLNDSLVWASPRERALRTDAAAEIVRLRGEVAPNMAGLVDSLIQLRDADWTLNNEPMPDDAQGVLNMAIEAIRNPAPAMPNGVDSVAYLLDELRFSRRGYFTSQRRGELADKLEAAIAADFDRLRAADNRDAAGVECRHPRTTASADGMYEFCDLCKADLKQTPAAVPAGEAVAWRFYVEDHPDLKPYWTGWGVDEWFRDQMVKRGCRAEYAHPPAATPPAPVQAAPQEGEAKRLIALIDAEISYNRNRVVGGRWSVELDEARKIAVALAANPSACELGAVREVAAEMLADASHYDDAKLRAWAGRLTAALQHRGDSRGGEG